MTTLSRPTHAEIDRLLRRAAANWPHLAKRIDNAAALLRPLALSWSQTRSAWLAHSQSDPTGATVLRHRRRRLHLPRLHPRQRQPRRRPHLLQAQHRLPRLPPHPARPPARALRRRGLQRRVPPHQAGRPGRCPGCPHAISSSAPRWTACRSTSATATAPPPAAATSPATPTWPASHNGCPWRWPSSQRIRADLEPAPQIWPPAGKLTPELIMAYDADQLPYEEWRALYLQEQ